MKSVNGIRYVDMDWKYWILQIETNSKEIFTQNFLQLFMRCKNDCVECVHTENALKTVTLSIK